MSATPRVAVVTGAGRGIGRAVVWRLAADGWAVVATDGGGLDDLESLLGYRLGDKDDLDATVEGVPDGSRVCAVPADVRDPAALSLVADEALARFGGLRRRGRRRRGHRRRRAVVGHPARGADSAARGQRRRRRQPGERGRAGDAAPAAAPPGPVHRRRFRRRPPRAVPPGGLLREQGGVRRSRPGARGGPSRHRDHRQCGQPGLDADRDVAADSGAVRAAGARHLRRALPAGAAAGARRGGGGGRLPVRGATVPPSPAPCSPPTPGSQNTPE